MNIIFSKYRLQRGTSYYEGGFVSALYALVYSGTYSVG